MSVSYIGSIIMTRNISFSRRELALLEASEALLFKRKNAALEPEVKFPYVFDSYCKARQTAG